MTMSVTSHPPTKQNPTLSSPNTPSNRGSRSTVTFTAPWNSCSIRATSSAIRRRSLLARMIMASEWKRVLPKSSWITDRREEVVGLRVERAIETQGITSPPPPPIDPEAEVHFLKVGEFGKVERLLLHREMASASTFRALEPARRGEGMGFTGDNGIVRQFHEGLPKLFYDPNSRGEELGRAMDLYLRKAQPGWDLQ